MVFARRIPQWQAEELPHPTSPISGQAVASVQTRNGSGRPDKMVLCEHILTLIKVRTLNEEGENRIHASSTVQRGSAGGHIKDTQSVLF